MSLLDIKNINLSIYGTPILRDVSLTVAPGQIVAITGESGSGKSTIGKMVVGLLQPTDGKVEIEGVDLARETDAEKIEQVRSDIQMIFQDPFASLNPRWKVRDIIAEGLDVKRSEVVPSASFIDDLNADSLDIVELVMGIEQDFSIEIPDDEAEKIRTVQDAIDYIVAHVG